MIDPRAVCRGSRLDNVKLEMLIKRFTLLATHTSYESNRNAAVAGDEDPSRSAWRRVAGEPPPSLELEQ